METNKFGQDVPLKYLGSNDLVDITFGSPNHGEPYA